MVAYRLSVVAMKPKASDQGGDQWATHRDVAVTVPLHIRLLPSRWPLASLVAKMLEVFGFISALKDVSLQATGAHLFCDPVIT